MGTILPDGRQVGVWNPHPRFFDISYVFIGADKTAKMMMKLGSGLWVPASVIDGEILYGFDPNDEELVKAASGCGTKCGLCGHHSNCDKFQKVAAMKKQSGVSHIIRRYLSGDSSRKYTTSHFETGEQKGDATGHLPYHHRTSILAKDGRGKMSLERLSSSPAKKVVEIESEKEAAARRITKALKSAKKAAAKIKVPAGSDDIIRHMLQRKTEKSGKTKKANGDETGPEPTSAQEQEIRNFIAKTPNLDDEKFHQFLEARGINPHKGEEVVYGILHGIEQGKIEPKVKQASLEMGPPPSPNRKEWPFVGTISFKGLKINVETKAGAIREGTDANGKHWSVKMLYPYGEIVGTKGTDRDKLDVYVGPKEDADTVYIVHQNHPDSHPTKAGKYDEDKVMLGFGSPAEAHAAYLEHYNDRSFFRSMTIMPFDKFKEAIIDEVKGEKVAAMEKVAVDMKLEDLFNGAKEYARRERIWKNKETGEETYHVGSGLGNSFSNMQKTASFGKALAEVGGLGLLAAPVAHEMHVTSEGKKLSKKSKFLHNVAELTGLGILAAPEMPEIKRGLISLVKRACEDDYFAEKLAAQTKMSLPELIARFGNLEDPAVARLLEQAKGGELTKKAVALGALKLAALKLADARKMAEIMKQLDPEGNMGRVSAVLSGREPSISKNTLNEMGKGDLESALATPSAMGMMLKPEEFQRIILAKIGRPDLADEFDRQGTTFPPSSESEAPCGAIDSGHFSSDIMKALMPLMESRSFLAPVVRRRIIRITIAQPMNDDMKTASSPLLTKIAAAYNWYKAEAVKMACDTLDVLSSEPKLAAAVVGLSDEGMMYEKIAAGLSNATLLSLGSVPAVLMYGAHARSKALHGQPITRTERFAANHPLLSSLGTAAGIRVGAELLGHVPKALE